MNIGGAAAGLQPVKSYSGAGHSGVIKHYAVAADDTNALFKGTPVKLAGGTDSNGLPIVTRADPGDALVGVAYGSRYIPERLPPCYIPYGPAVVMVYTDPHMEFEMNVPAADFDLATDVEVNFDLTAEVGDTCYGFSTVTIDPATKKAAGDATGQVRILREVQAPYSRSGAYCAEPEWLSVIVRINTHQYMQNVASL